MLIAAETATTNIRKLTLTLALACATLCLLWNVGAFALQPTPFLPNSTLTPGDVFDVTREEICAPGYSKKVRDVPKSLRDRAFENYDIPSDQRREYQLDHLIPLALGGSNSIKNLWPQPNNTSPWNARAKDRLERRLHELVCDGQLDPETAQRKLETVQREIAANWTEAYRKYFGASPPVAAKGEPLLAPNTTDSETLPEANAPNAPENEVCVACVWVNTRSGVYWKPGSEFYGNTKQGKYMVESDAVAAGYRPARGVGH
jgi:hypothetical protein